MYTNIGGINVTSHSVLARQMALRNKQSYEGPSIFLRLHLCMASELSNWRQAQSIDTVPFEK